MTSIKPRQDDNQKSTGHASTSLIDLYIFDLEPAPDVLEHLRHVLAKDERARADRLINKDAGNRFITARATLRHVLATYTGTPPADLKFSYATHAKPFLPDHEGSLFFNLSHSSDVGAIAVSEEFNLGVDVEAWRDVHSGIANRFFSKSETEALSALPEQQRTRAFFQCWTRKEAIIKALGDGFARPLNSFDVSIIDEPLPPVTRFLGEENANVWKLISFSPRPNVSGAVACRSGNKTLKLRHRPIPY